MFRRRTNKSSSWISENTYRRERIRMLRLERLDSIAESRIQRRTYTIIKYTFFINIFLSGALVVATLKTMNHARVANIISSRNGYLQVRAYITETGILVHADGISNVAAKLPPETGVTFRNFGQTPAYKVVAYNATSIVPVTEPIKLPYFFSDYCEKEEAKFSLNSTGVSLPPSLSQTFFNLNVLDNKGDVRTEFSDAEQANFIDSKSFLYYWGIVCYSDIFGDRHFKRYCRYFSNHDNLGHKVESACVDNDDPDEIPSVE